MFKVISFFGWMLTVWTNTIYTAHIVVTIVTINGVQKFTKNSFNRSGSAAGLGVAFSEDTVQTAKRLVCTCVFRKPPKTGGPTSRPKYKWTIPKKQTKIHPQKVTDFVLKKSHYTKTQIDLNKENEMSKSQETKNQDVCQIRQGLHTLLRSDMPNYCFSLSMDKRRIETDKKIE